MNIRAVLVSVKSLSMDHYANVVRLLTLTRPIGLPPHAPVAQKVAEQCKLIASLVKKLFVRVDWTEHLRDDSSTTD